MNIKTSIKLILIALVSQACTTLVPTVDTGQHEEDLSVYRIDYSKFGAEEDTIENIDLAEYDEMEPTHDVTKEIDEIVSAVAERNSEIDYFQGFTIQVYSGSNRNDANEAKRKVYMRLSDIQPNIQYQQPNYKVQVGEFIERIEAQKTYASLKEIFPNAIIIPATFSNN